MNDAERIQELVEKRNAFCELLESTDAWRPTQRGVLCNEFLAPIRQHDLSEPQEVCRAVYIGVTNRRLHAEQASHGYAAEAGAKWGALLDTMKLHKEAALDVARWALAWEALPPRTKETIKAANHQPYAESSMSQKPPTQKQIDYLAALGHDAEVDSRLEASRLIDQLTTTPTSDESSVKCQ